jgi:hypothetical protein
MFNLNYKNMKSRITLVIASLAMFVIGSPNANADCTLTTKPGVNGRCFNENGEFVCLERDEDQSCIIGAEC